MTFQLKSLFIVNYHILLNTHIQTHNTDTHMHAHTNTQTHTHTRRYSTVMYFVVLKF